MFSHLILNFKMFVAQFLGNSCGQHGSYTFYRGIHYWKDDRRHSLSIGEFFHGRLNSSEQVIPLIGELQLLWEEKNREGLKLSSVRLYILPENCPAGRLPHHGQVGSQNYADFIRTVDIQWQNMDACFFFLISEEFRWLVNAYFSSLWLFKATIKKSIGIVTALLNTRTYCDTRLSVHAFLNFASVVYKRQYPVLAALLQLL